MSSKPSKLKATKSNGMTMLEQQLSRLPEPWKPHGYQKKSVKWLLEHACAGLLQDPGLGKTSETLAALTILMKKKLVRKTLIVAPLQACSDTWPDERSKWTDFAHLRMVFLHGPNKDKFLEQDADIYLINPEGLEWLLGVTKTKTAKGKIRVDIDHKRVKDLGFDVLVLDELSLFKHISSHRFKAMKHALGYFGRRWGLTGSPAANGLLDLFGQCYMLDMGACLGPYITSYRMNYFYQPNPNDMFSWVLGPGKEQEIYKKISPLMLSMKAEDYLEMPELVPVDIKVKLPEKAYAQYLAMEEELIVELGKHTVTAATSAVASMKCRQIANGGLYLPLPPKSLDGAYVDRTRKTVHIHDAKTDALEALIGELQGQPLLVAYDFDHDLDRLKKRFGKDIPYIGSGVSLARRTELKNLWNAGKLPVLFGQPQSMARSLNLQESGHHVCWYGLTWNFETYDQFNRRVLRQGNKSKKVFIYHLIAVGTTDHIVMRSLRAKDTTQKSLFAGLKELAKKR